MNSEIYKAPNGVTIRQDKEALFGFLPHIGFAFYAPREDFARLKNILQDENNGIVIPREYQGIFEKKSPFHAGQPHVFGQGPDQWKNLPVGDTPLVINWMITGECNFKCVYCYARDLMHQAVAEPDEDLIWTTLDHIMSFNPVAVVLTGGEPLLNPFLDCIIQKLSLYTSVVIDTNATLLEENHVRLFQENQVHVRVSLDSHRSQINMKTRIAVEKKAYSKLFQHALDGLSLLKEYKVPVTINTVATTKNYDDILRVQEIMRNFGIVKMRVRLVEDWGASDSYQKLLGDEKRLMRAIGRLDCGGSEDNLPPLYCSRNRQRNSVVLVGPNGYFYTESQLEGRGKILIDEDSPQRPSDEAIKRNVDVHAHASRYLCL